MPWILKGKTIYKKVGNRLIKKQTAKSVENAKKALALLRGLETGTILEFEVGKRRRKKR